MSSSTRLLRDARLPLRVVYLLTGSALALSLMTLDLIAANALWSHEPVWLMRGILTLVVLVPPSLLGLIPQVRQIEGAAATSLLGVDFGGHQPGLSRTWDQRWRTSAWFWGHLLAGAFAGFVVIVATTGGAVLLVRTWVAPAGEDLLGLPWLTVSDGPRDLLLFVGGLFVLLLAILLLLLAAEGLVMVAPMLLGPSVPELLDELETRTAHLVERTRLARELHDSVGHALNVVVLQAAAARRRLAGPDGATDRATDPTRVPDETAHTLSVVEDVARKALEDLDGVLGLLREEEGARRRQPVHDLESLDGLVRAAVGAGQVVSVETDLGDLADLPGVVSREAYRIVQEAITNALRHAPGQPVDVRLARADAALRIAVSNAVAPTRGTIERRRRTGRGLAGVRERVRILGGSLEVGACDGIWRLDVTLPLPSQERP